MTKAKPTRLFLELTLEDGVGEPAILTYDINDLKSLPLLVTGASSLYHYATRCKRYGRIYVERHGLVQQQRQHRRALFFCLINAYGIEF